MRYLPVLGWIVVVSCSSAPSPPTQSLPESDSLSIGEGWDSMRSEIETGDLVFRRGRDMTSYMLRQLNLEDKRYSHCGLVIIEQGYPFVYHSLGGEENPELALRRDSLDQWVNPLDQEAVAVYRLPLDTLMRTRVAQQAWKFYGDEIPFDMNFDLSTEDRFYCVEFVYRTLFMAQGGRWDIPRSRFHGFEFLGIDDLYLKTDGKWIGQLEYK